VLVDVGKVKCVSCFTRDVVAALLLPDSGTEKDVIVITVSLASLTETISCVGMPLARSSLNYLNYLKKTYW